MKTMACTLLQAKRESILRVRSNDPLKLLQAAYHLGNRHIPIEIEHNYLQLEADPVLEEMLKRLGVEINQENAPFEPEHGAYGGGHKHGHDASFNEDYALAQAVYHSHHSDHCDVIIMTIITMTP
jgi:urease accessory protein